MPEPKTTNKQTNKPSAGLLSYHQEHGRMLERQGEESDNPHLQILPEGYENRAVLSVSISGSSLLR